MRVQRRLQHGHAVLVDDLQLEFGFRSSPSRGCVGETLKLRQTRLCQTNTVLCVCPAEVYGAQTQINLIRHHDLIGIISKYLYLEKTINDRFINILCTDIKS